MPWGRQNGFPGFFRIFFQKLFPESPGRHKTHFKAHIITKMMMVLDLLQHY